MSSLRGSRRSTMDNSGPVRKAMLAETRRHFFERCAVGVGQMALAGLLSRDLARAQDLANPMAPKPPHFPAKIKSIIYLYMAGGPSQFELFDDKPALRKLDGQPI